MRFRLMQGDARKMDLPDRSVHMVATSPPFFGLRDYNHPGQIGLEPTPGEFVEAMRAVGREVWRVLRDDGSFWLNLGDSFNAYNGNRGKSTSFSAATESQLPALPSGYGLGDKGLKPKDLMLIPERVAIALQGDGWYVRAKPPWIKPNPMPDSTDDRPNVAHESIFLLTKSPRYYFDMEAVRVPSAASTLARDAYSRITQSGNKSYVPDSSDHSGLHKPYTGILSRPTLGLGGEHRGPKYAVAHDHETPSDPGGRHLRTNDFFMASLDAAIEDYEAYTEHLKHIRDRRGLLLSEGGDPLAFWQATKSFRGAHFATWPQRLVEPMIKASTSEYGCCRDCGAPWSRVVEREPMVIARSGRGDSIGDVGHGRTATSGTMVSPPRTETLGWEPGCSCGADVVPCTVLDPFCGSGTTVLAAVNLGRFGIGNDLNADYLEMARARIETPCSPPRPSVAATPEPSFDDFFGVES